MQVRGRSMWSVKAKSVSRSIVSDSLGPRGLEPSGSSVHGILQTTILEWVAIPFSRGSSQPSDWTQVSYIVGRFFNIWATWEAPWPATKCRLHFLLPSLLVDLIQEESHSLEVLCGEIKISITEKSKLEMTMLTWNVRSRVGAEPQNSPGCGHTRVNATKIFIVICLIHLHTKWLATWSNQGSKG